MNTHIYETHRDEFVSRLAALGYRADLAEDAVQEAAIELWEHEPCGPGLFWLAARRHATKAALSQQRRTVVEELASCGEGYDVDVDWELDYAHAIARLTDREQQAATLRAWGATTTQIGGELGVSQQAASQLLAAAETTVWQAIAG